MADPVFVVDSLGVTEEMIAARLATMQLAPQDRESLESSWNESVGRRSVEFAARLYARFREVPVLASLLASESRVARLINIQQGYLREMFCARIDREYVARRLAIGATHHRLRVTPQWYLAAMAHFVADHVEPLLESSADRGEGIRRIATLLRTALFDASLTLDAYGRMADAMLVRRPVMAGGGNELAPSDPAEVRANESQESVAGEYAAPRLRLSDEETAARVRFLEMDGRDARNMKSLRGGFEAVLPEVLDEFYRFITQLPALAGTVDERQVRRLTAQVAAYWREFTAVTFDRHYAVSRMRVGIVHERIGLDPQWYLAGLARQASGFLRAIPSDHPQLAAVIRSFLKTLAFDLTFVMDAYMEARAATLLRTQGYAQQLMAGLSSAVVIVDRRARIQFANESFVEKTGVEPSLLYMMALKDVVPIVELQQAMTQLKQERTGRVACVGKWGETPFRMTVMELEERADRHHHSVAVVFDDVTDMLRLSDGMERDVSQHEHLADAVSAVLWEMDWKSHTLLSVSQAAIDLLGHRDIFLLGRPDAWQSSIVEEDRGRFAACCESIEKVPFADCEYRMRRADGQEIWVRSRMSRVGGNSVAPTIAAVTLDITASRQAERLRFASLEQFASGVAQVVSNSLAVISANIELHGAKWECREPTPHLEEALRAIKRAASVIGQLRAFARGQYLRPRVISISDALRDASRWFQTTVGPAIRLKLDLAQDAWNCHVDGERLITAVGHLCENAALAMPEGGEVAIVTRNVGREVAQLDDPGMPREWVQLQVVDRGVGMTNEVKRQALDPFFTTGSSRERLGLGLSAVHGFVAQSGGHLVLTSEPGVGSTITLRFPRWNETAPMSGERSLAQGNSTVLVVDSDEAVLDATSSLCCQLGYTTLAARNAQEALPVVAREAIDVLIVERLLGGTMDGLDLARHLRATLPQLGVVLMSSYGVLAAPGSELPDEWPVIEKPFSLDALDRAVKQAIARPTSLSSDRTPLSSREREVLRLIATGKSQADVAAILRISERTVEQHVRNARRKLNVANTIQAVVEALARGEIEP